MIIPADNVKDLKEIPDNIKAHLDIKPVRWIDEVLGYALNGYPNQLPGRKKKLKAKSKGVAMQGSASSAKKFRKGDRARTH